MWLPTARRVLTRDAATAHRQLHTCQIYALELNVYGTPQLLPHSPHTHTLKSLIYCHTNEISCTTFCSRIQKQFQEVSICTNLTKHQLTSPSIYQSSFITRKLKLHFLAHLLKMQIAHETVKNHYKLLHSLHLTSLSSNLVTIAWGQRNPKLTN